MKILIRNKSAAPVPYLLRCSGEKVGYIYYLKPDEDLEVNFLGTHRDGLVAESDSSTVYSFSYQDFPKNLEITFVER